MTDPSPWWDRDIYADRRPFLLARGRILSALREWFRRRGFLEVDTPALQVSPGNEIHLHAFATELATPGGGRAPLYLHTSPEFTCKKLLAAGEPRIFSVAHVFRNRERGPLHHPEFTMLEWYRTNEPYEALMEDCAAILVEAAKAAGGLQLQWKDRTADPYAAPERLSVADAFVEFAGIDLIATLEGGEGDRDKLAAAARAAGIAVADDDNWSDVFSRVLVERIEPRLGPGPADAARSISAARGGLGAARRRSAVGAALRALCLRRRTRQRLRRDHRRGRAAPPLRRRRWRSGSAAMASNIRSMRISSRRSPPCRRRAGIALGFDRLVMLATGAARIEQVLWAPVAGDDR